MYSLSKGPCHLWSCKKRVVLDWSGPWYRFDCSSFFHCYCWSYCGCFLIASSLLSISLMFCFCGWSYVFVYYKGSLSFQSYGANIHERAGAASVRILFEKYCSKYCRVEKGIAIKITPLQVFILILFPLVINKLATRQVREPSWIKTGSFSSSWHSPPRSWSDSLISTFNLLLLFLFLLLLSLAVVASFKMLFLFFFSFCWWCKLLLFAVSLHAT